MGTYEIAKIGGYLLSPLTMGLGLLLLAALCLGLGRRRWAGVLAVVAFVGLWVGSTPAMAKALTLSLESAYPASTVEATAAADAVIVLGGAVGGVSLPQRPTLNMGSEASRVWHTAALYRSGKARWVVIAAGGQPATENEQIEADAIAQMLAVLGVPAEVLRRDLASRNTRENATNARLILTQLGVRRALLVTSAMHMPRALATFRKTMAGSGIEVIPAPTDNSSPGVNYFTIWDFLPTPGALLNVTKAVKEFAGALPLAMM
jgi:uncharacterized SAM-binding protein YcdF (DUF218 family)